MAGLNENNLAGRSEYFAEIAKLDAAQHAWDEVNALDGHPSNQTLLAFLKGELEPQLAQFIERLAANDPKMSTRLEMLSVLKDQQKHIY